MPTSRHSKKTTTKKAANFPVMFYQSVSTEKLEKNAAVGLTPHFGPALRQRQILMWSGVAVVSAALLFLWGANAAERIQGLGSNNIGADFSFFKKQELTQILKEGDEKIEQIKNLETIFKKAAAAPAFSNTLSSQQLKNLKNKIENKK